MNTSVIENEPQCETTTSQPMAYEAPAIESVLTPESLEREVHYAGAQAGSGVPLT